MTENGEALKAKWIWKPGTSKPDEYVRFYDVFPAEHSARIKISCDSNYELLVNGRRAGFGQYADFPHHKVYDEIDISPYLKEGKNVLEILVWYIGEGSFTYYPSTAGLYYKVSCGKEVLAVSDETTLCCDDPCYIAHECKKITSQLGFSYSYDARGLSAHPKLECAVPAPKHKLFPRPVKKLRLTGAVAGKLIDRDKCLYDLGRECAGYLNTRFRVESGAVVTIAFGEHIADGEVRQIIGRRDFSVTLIGNGEMIDFSNYMRRLGCRYLQVKCDRPVEVVYVGIDEVLYPLNVLPFDAGNDLRQKIYDTSVRTLQLCMHEHYEDCPWREQALYALDSRNQMLYGYYAFGEYDFPRACLKLFALEQHPDGHIAICSPTGEKFCIPFFSLAYCLAMCEYVAYSHDTTLFEEDYGRVKGILDIFMNRESENDLVVSYYDDRDYWNFYEWSDDLAGCCMEPDSRRVEVVLNAFFSIVLREVAKVAESLGKHADAESYLNRASKVNAAINRRFFRKEEGLYINHDSGKFSELGNALCVLAGAASKKVAKEIGRRIAEGTIPVKASLSMHGFVYDALLAIGPSYSKYILDRIDTIYGKMLAAGATSFWETELGEADFDGAGSLCHGWSALPVYYYRKLLK